MRAHFEGLTQIVNGRPNWTGEVRLDESILDWPLRWKKPRRIFVASSGDIFHESLGVEKIKLLFQIMREAPHHTYQILTKRAERLAEFSDWWAMQHCDPMPANWWMGVSVENRKTIPRLAYLRQASVTVRWASLEPLLEDLGDIGGALRHDCPIPDCDGIPKGGLDWAVIGGESGRGARPCNTEWVRSIAEQCKAANVSYFVKQLGSHVIQGGVRRFKKDRKGGDMDEWEHDLRVREFPR